MLALRKSTVRSAPGNGDRRAPGRLHLGPESVLSRQGEAGQHLADAALVQVANCYKHQAHRLINTYFSQREHLAVYHELTSRVMMLAPELFGLHKDDAGGESDVLSLARLEDTTAEFFPEIARSVLETQLLRLENGEPEMLEPAQAVEPLQAVLFLPPAHTAQPARPLESSPVLPVQAASDYLGQGNQPDLGEIDKLIKQILAMEVSTSGLPQTPAGRAD